MCSVATNLLTSLDFRPVRCAITPCLFGRTQYYYVATHFILFSGTAESSVKSGCVVVPERIGQNEERASGQEERTKKTWFCCQQWIWTMHYLNTCKQELYPSIICSVFYVFYFSVEFFVISFYGKSFRCFVEALIYCVGARITTWMSISDGLDLYLFLSVERWRRRGSWKKKCTEKCFSLQSPHFSFRENKNKVLFPILTLNKRVHMYVSRQRKRVNRRSENIFAIT